MRILRLLPLAFLCFCSVAQAADTVDETMVEADPVYDWSGFYAGVHAGYLAGDVDSFIPSLPFNYSTEPDGFVGGVLAGYQMQSGQFVFGVEADVGAASAKDSYTDGVTFATDEFEWTGSLRGRVGVAFDRFLPFVTGGVAVAGVKSTDDFVGGGDFQSIDRTLVGYVVGAGVEALVTQQMSARIEVLYSDYGSETFAFTEPLFVTEKDFSATTVRAAVTWQF